MAAAWKEYGTGGGCMALLRQEADGRHWLLTDWLDPKLPVAGKPAALGLYDADGEQLAQWRITTYGTPEEAFRGLGGRQLTYTVQGRERFLCTQCALATDDVKLALKHCMAGEDAHLMVDTQREEE